MGPLSIAGISMRSALAVAIIVTKLMRLMVASPATLLSTSCPVLSPVGRGGELYECGRRGDEGSGDAAAVYAGSLLSPPSFWTATELVRFLRTV